MGTAMNLMRATEIANCVAVYDCLARGEEVDQRDDIAFTPLIRAAYDNSIDIAQALISNGADVNAQCEESWTAAAYALMNGHFDMALLLGRSGASLDHIDQEVFMGEDEVITQRAPMEKLVAASAGLDTWNRWEAYRAAHDLDMAAPRARSIKSFPRL